MTDTAGLAGRLVETSLEAIASACGSRGCWDRKRPYCSWPTRQPPSASHTSTSCSSCSDACTAQGERTLVAVLHDLNQAAHYADHLIAMSAGQIITTGAPDDVLTAD